MEHGETGYLSLLADIIHVGDDRPDRTGTGTRSMFGTHLKFNLEYGFPLLTTKKIEFKAVSSELLWFLEGSSDERRLAELRYGKPAAQLNDKKTIWSANAEATYWDSAYHGDVGRIYGVQWRKWKNYRGETIDQVARLIDGIKKDPFGRRHILSAWNPGELDEMALPACHCMVQFYVTEDGYLSAQWYQRSVDVLLGLPFNIASYALLTHMVAQVCNLKPFDLTFSGGDTHIYKNHFDAVNEQRNRTPRKLPKLVMDTSITDIDKFTMSSFSVEGYDPYPAIKAPMAV